MLSYIDRLAIFIKALFSLIIRIEVQQGKRESVKKLDQKEKYPDIKIDIERFFAIAIYYPGIWFSMKNAIIIHSVLGTARISKIMKKGKKRIDIFITYENENEMRKLLPSSFQNRMIENIFITETQCRKILNWQTNSAPLEMKDGICSIPDAVTAVHPDKYNEIPNKVNNLDSYIRISPITLLEALKSDYSNAILIIGTAVKHKIFGSGIVNSLEIRRNNLPIVTISFSKQEEDKMFTINALLSYPFTEIKIPKDKISAVEQIDEVSGASYDQSSENEKNVSKDEQMGDEEQIPDESLDFGRTIGLDSLIPIEPGTILAILEYDKDILNFVIGAVVKHETLGSGEIRSFEGSFFEEFRTNIFFEIYNQIIRFKAEHLISGGFLEILVKQSKISKISGLMGSFKEKNKYYREHKPVKQSSREVSKEIIPNDEITGQFAEKEITPNNEIIEQFAKYNISKLWHMSHIDNLESISRRGILSHNDAHGTDAIHDISDYRVQNLRKKKKDPFSNMKLYDFVPLYINPRNPMLYVRRNIQHKLCMIEVDMNVLRDNYFVFTDGNAASGGTEFYNDPACIKHLPWDVLKAEYWNDYLDGKRKRCAEVLVYPSIRPEYINCYHFKKNIVNSIESDKPMRISSELYF